VGISSCRRWVILIVVNRLTAHFGEWVVVEGEKKLVWLIVAMFLYAQVIKHQRGFRLVGVEHRMLWGDAEEYRSRLKANGLSGNINTSFVERANLTIRQSVSKLTRRTWGPAKLKSELEDHLYWWLAAARITSLVHTRACGSHCLNLFLEKESRDRGYIRR